MPTDAVDARALLRVAPDDYVKERARLVKQARSDGDRTRARSYQSLQRPPLSLWAVLAAGDDADAIHGIVTATAQLAEIQARGGDPSSLLAATQHRRKALESLVDRAVTALSRWSSGAQTRRPEIRGIVDQLSRHPDRAEAWLDGTLRDVPDDAFGFAAFTDLQVTAHSHSDAPVKAQPARRTGRTPAHRTDNEASQRSAERVARAARARQTRQARQDAAVSARELAAAERRLDNARTALRESQAEMLLAEANRAAAEQRHEQANARIEATQDE